MIEKTLRTASVIAATPMRLIRPTRWDLTRAGSDMDDQLRATIAERRPAPG